MFDQYFTQKELEKRKLYFQLLYPVFLISYSFFLFKFNFEYKIYTYNTILIPIFFFSVVAIPFVHLRMKNIYLSISLFYIVMLSAGAFLVYVSGGFHAPGVFWISAIPLMGIMFLGRKGFWLGVFCLIVVYVLYMYADMNHLQSVLPFSTDHTFYDKEKKINLTIFLVVIVLITYFYGRVEDKYFTDLKVQKDRNDNLLRVLFHDVANPVFSMQLKLNKLKKMKGELTEEQIKLLNSLEESSKKLALILENVRKMKSIQDGKTLIDIENFTTKDLISESLGAVEDKLSRKAITVSFVDNVGDKSISGNKVIFTNQVIVNILTNAIKFSDQGKTIHIHSYVDEKKNFIVVEIRDEGIGIPPHILKNLFSDEILTSRKGLNGELGTGYGMPLVKFFMDQFEGKVEVSSKEIEKNPTEHGTTFKLYFKLGREV